MGGPAAVKMPADPKPYDSEETIAEGLERLQQEIDVLTGPLRHLQGLAVPRVLAVGTLVDPQVPVLALELLEPLSKGSSLSKQEQETLCAHLQAIHEAGVLHGDLRPDMIMRARSSSPGSSSMRICDFSHSVNASDLGRSALEYASEQKHFVRMLEGMAPRHGPRRPITGRLAACLGGATTAAGGNASVPSSIRMRCQRRQPFGPLPARFGQSMRRVHPSAFNLSKRLPCRTSGTFLRGIC